MKLSDLTGILIGDVIIVKIDDDSGEQIRIFENEMFGLDNCPDDILEMKIDTICDGTTATVIYVTD